MASIRLVLSLSIAIQINLSLEQIDRNGLFVINVGTGTPSYVMQHLEAFRLGRFIQLLRKHVLADVFARDLLRKFFENRS